MKKSIVALATAAVFTGAMAGTASAQEYEVNKGDTLWGISKHYGTTVENLKKWNNLGSDIIYPDQELTVSPLEHYSVGEGDTLWGIANEYGVTVDQVKEWNKLSSDLIKPGQSLVIYLNDKASSAPVQQKTEAPKEEAKPAAPAKETAATAAAPSSQPANTEKAAPAKAEAASSEDSNVAKELTVKATGYTADCEGCSGITATGMNVKDNPNAKVISVDPSVIPLGSKVFVEGYGYATAADTGGAIKGNRIDILFPSKDQAMDWGVRTVKVKVLK
ncbi:LysM peptidoglycan-binding domain-containing protein [Falsibacillus pallidus]|uniref:3D domain-containing protein n=1 Tax=Falsibacillus pallidus TaxID=493781 RepID=UPI003D951313